MTPVEAEWNGVYRMLAMALAEHYDVCGDRLRAIAARTIAFLYDHELHAARMGAPGRRPEWDMERVANGLLELGLDNADPAAAGRALARLLDGKPDEYSRMSGRTVEPPHATVNGGDMFGVVEDMHNALRRITPPNMWETLLDRRIMLANLDRLTPLAAHAIRLDRDGDNGEPIVEAMIPRCNRRGRAWS